MHPAALVLAVVTSLMGLHPAHVVARHEHHVKNADPVPIPGGIQIPDGPLIHTFGPGPEAIGGMGLDIEPNTITDFNGFMAIAYLGGTATDASGHVYSLQCDIRAMRGEYVGADDKRHHGTFGFV